jgi:hypothetical protein
VIEALKVLSILLYLEIAAAALVVITSWWLQRGSCARNAKGTVIDG